MKLKDVINTKYGEALDELVNNVVIMSIYKLIDTLIMTKKKSLSYFKKTGTPSSDKLANVYYPIEAYNTVTGMEYSFLSEGEFRLAKITDSGIKRRSFCKNAYTKLASGELEFQDGTDVSVEYIPGKGENYYVYDSEGLVKGGLNNISEDINDILGSVYANLHYTSQFNQLIQNIIEDYNTLSTNSTTELANLLEGFESSTEYAAVTEAYNMCLAEWNGEEGENNGIKHKLDAINEEDFASIKDKIDEALARNEDGFVSGFEAEKEKITNYMAESYASLVSAIENKIGDETSFANIKTNLENRLFVDDIEVANSFLQELSTEYSKNSNQVSSLINQLSTTIQDNSSKMGTALNQYGMLLNDTIQRASGLINTYQADAGVSGQRVQNLLGQINALLQMLQAATQQYSIFIQGLSAKYQSYAQVYSVKVQELTGKFGLPQLFVEKIKLTQNNIKEELEVLQ